jgi:SAM-dependent methyltransferase
MVGVSVMVCRPDGKLEVALLGSLACRPPLFEPGDALFWKDPYISQQMLEAHLDPLRDAASRRHETIDASSKWLVEHLGLAPGSRVLDLGCGPGLYCTRFHRYGLKVTGLDYSPRSIEYAKQYAQEHGLAIEYLCRDYLTMEYNEQFDAAFLIYCDLGALSNLDRDNLLVRVQRALKPGGLFAFDVWTHDHHTIREASSWEFKDKGFWSPEPYLCLHRKSFYPEDDTFVDQYVVTKEDLSVNVYRVWDHVYSAQTIALVLTACGFSVKEVWGDLAGKPHDGRSVCMGVICRT